MPKSDFIVFKRELEKKRRLGKVVPRPQVDKDLLKTLGIDENAFNEGFGRLCSKWWDLNISSMLDCTGKRLVTSTLASKLNNPLVLSIIADDIDCFKSYYNTEEFDIFYLEFCCLCGAEKIIKNVYLNDEYKKQCLTKSENVIAYALSSGNNELVISLAEKIRFLGKITPGPLMLYCLGNYNLAKNILEMFAADNTKNEELDTKKPRLM